MHAKGIVPFLLCKKHSDLQLKGVGMKGSEFIFRGLGSGNGVTEERINQEKKD